MLHFAKQETEGDAEAVLAADEAARGDLLSFLRWVPRLEKGQHLSVGLLHRLMAGHVEWCRARGVYAQVIAPRRHGKSVISQGLTAFEIGRDPNVRIKFVCASEPQAVKRVGFVQRLLDSQTYRRVFPHVLGPPEQVGRDGKGPRKPKFDRLWSKTQLQVNRRGEANSNDPTVEGAGVLGTGVGGGADLIILDDVNDRRNAIEQPELLPKVIDGALQTWLSQLEPGGFAVSIQTLWTTNDLAHVLMGEEGWVTFLARVNEAVTGLEATAMTADESHPLAKVPGARLTEEGWFAEIPFWELRDREALLEIRGKVGSRGFVQGYQQRLVHRGQRTFPSADRALRTEGAEGGYPPETLARPAGAMAVGIGVDLSRRQRSGTCVALAALGADGRRYLLHIEARAITGPQTVDRLAALAWEAQVDFVKVESNSYQQTLLEWMERAVEMAKGRPEEAALRFLQSRASGFETQANKNSELSGLPRLELEFRQNAWVIPSAMVAEHGRICRDGADGGKCDWCRHAEELRTHPANTGDTIMALWLASEGLREFGGVSDPETAFSAFGQAGMIEMGRGPIETGDEDFAVFRDDAVLFDDFPWAQDLGALTEFR